MKYYVEAIFSDTDQKWFLYFIKDVGYWSWVVNKVAITYFPTKIIARLAFNKYKSVENQSLFKVMAKLTEYNFRQEGK